MKYILCFFILMVANSYAQQLSVVKTTDFTINGKGDAKEWSNSSWLRLPHREGKMAYETKMKMMYSDSGIYCLYHNADDKITSTMTEDYADLWKEDVVEIFFWTDEKVPIYFEYEISPRNFELPILVPNLKGKFFGWRPWHYNEGEGRKIMHATDIQPEAWTAEFFIPYKLLLPLTNVPPTKGMKWRCNMYRIDHDDGASEWSWKPVLTNFHDFERFGVIEFE